MVGFTPSLRSSFFTDATNSELGYLLRKDESEADAAAYEEVQRKYAFIPDGSFMPPTLDLSLDWVNKRLYLQNPQGSL